MSNRSQANSLRAKLSQPNRKAMINQYKRIHDPLTHHRIVTNMQNDR